MSRKINCVIVDDEPIAREIISNYIDKLPNLQLINSCKNVKDAIEIFHKNKVDLFFLDINMPEISGISFAKIIGQKSKVIFTTAYRDFAVDGFNLNAVDYLLKPISFERFAEAIEKLSEITLSENKKFIFVRSERKMVKINFDDILYIESLSDYVKIYLRDKRIVTRENISTLEEILPPQNFIRIHRSYIVSLAKIQSYTNETVEVNKKELPISRSYKSAVLLKLADV